MKDESEEVKQEQPAISLNSETGELIIDEERFGLSEKPYTVRILLQTYKECKEYLE